MSRFGRLTTQGIKAMSELVDELNSKRKRWDGEGKTYVDNDCLEARAADHIQHLEDALKRLSIERGLLDIDGREHTPLQCMIDEFNARIEYANKALEGKG